MNKSLLPEGYADVLFQDDHLIVCNKYPGVSVIPERRPGEGSVSLRERLEQASGEKVFVIHRIDRATSGLVLFGKTAQTHRLLSLQFERRQVQKEYLVLVHGVMSDSLSIDAPLRQFGSGRMGVHPDGKPSITAIEVVERLQGTTLVKAMPQSGRRHQIRVHLYHTGHPVMGDCLYGRERPVGGVERLMLHAASISLTYPEGRTFSISAPVDTLWERTVRRYRQSEETPRTL